MLYFLAQRISPVLEVSGRYSLNTIDGKKQDLNVAQTAKDGSATLALPNHQFKLSEGPKVDVGRFSMPITPNDRDVMPKVPGAM